MVERKFHDVDIRMAAHNIRSIHDITPPHVQESGQRWYQDVHEAVSKGIRRSSIDIPRGSGMVAAVSPNMDWENNNIHALGELRSLKSAHWDHISKHAALASQHRSLANQAKKAGDFDTMEKHRQIAKAHTKTAQEPLAGMSIKSAPLGGLIKAHRLMQGQHPEEVLPRDTAPKTNSFYHNIAEPDKPGPVTIDGRAADISENKLRPWDEARGISKGSYKNGQPTRYEQMEQAHRVVADSLTRDLGRPVLPHEVQAITWEGAKHIERAQPTKSGKPRQQGPTRAGQPYIGPGSLASSARISLPGL
jgi:hypothetical protein